MDELERQKFIKLEIEALYEELDKTIDKLVALKPFFEDLLVVTRGGEPSFKFGNVF